MSQSDGVSLTLRAFYSVICGFNIDDICPEDSVISRFRTAVTKAGTYEFLFKEIDKQLEAHFIIAKTGATIDSSIVDSSF